MSLYITTPIFYACGNPHLGHAYSGFIADALKRYYQLKGTDAFLLTGTDENGQKIERTAKLLDTANTATGGNHVRMNSTARRLGTVW